jgi:hypothetical protein
MATSAATLQRLATEYQSLGLPAIPIRQGRPLVRWEPYQDRLPTPEEIEGWPWGQADGLAVITGHRDPLTGLHWWVLDIERQHRARAEAWLDEEHPGWRKGLVAESQRGGLHVYCLSRQPVPTTKHPWGDIKGVGGLVYAPPTKAYKPDATGDYRWLSFNPEEALELEPTDLPWPDGNGHRREPLGETLRLERTIPVGARNTVLTRVAGWLRGEGQLEPDEVLAVLRLMNRRCEEPLPDEELETIARSASKWSPNPVLVVGNGHRHSLITGISESESDEPEAIDVSTLPEPPRRGWLVPDLLPEGTVTSWYGDDGTGKSVLALALASCVASGKPFLDRPVQQGTVLYVDTEFDQDEFIRRAYQLSRGMGLAAPPAGVFYYRTRYSLTTPGGQRDIVRLVERYQPTLVVVDSVTLGTYTDDLKEAAAAVTLMEFLQQLPTTVLALDHIPKPPPGASLAHARPWGSFAKRAKTRHAVLISQAEAGGIVLRVTKSNLAKAGAMVGADITWESDAIRVTAVSLDDEALAGIEHHLPALEQVYRTLCQHETMTPEELSEETGLAVGTIRNKLTALRHQGRAEPLGDGRWRGIGPATLVVRDGSHSPFTHYIGGVNGESEPNGRHSPGDSSQPTPVVRDDDHRPFTVHSLYSESESDDGDGKHHNPHREAKNGEHDPAGEAGHDPEKHHTPHRGAKIGEHDPGGHASQAVITITHYKASDSDDGGGKHHTSHREAKIGGHSPAGGTGHEPGKHHTWLPDAENAVCEVCGQLFTWSGRGQPARHCSRTCQMKAYRQRWSSADTPGHGVPVPTAAEKADSGPPDPGICLDCGQPITAEGFQYRCPACLKARYDRLQREYPEKLVRWLQTHDQKEGGR